MGGIAHGELDNGQEGVHTRQTDESTRQMETVYADMQTCRHAASAWFFSLQYVAPQLK